MLVVRGIDELHVNPHAIAFPAHTSFQNGADVEGFADLARIMRLPAIRHDRGARDHFQVADLGQVRQEIVLDAVSEIGVLRVVAEIRERQDGDRFLETVGGTRTAEKIAGHNRNTRPVSARTDRILARLR